MPQSGGSIYKRDKTWYIRSRADGRDVRRAAGRTRQAAVLLRAKLLEQAERKRLGLPVQSNWTLKDWAPEFQKWSQVHRRGWRNDRNYFERHLLPAFGHLRLQDITRQRVEAYQRARLAEQPAPANGTINREVAQLRRALSLAVEHGHLDYNFLRGVKMLREAPPRMPSLSREAEARLLAALRPWAAAMVRLALATGCRRGELLALRWRHIDFEAAALIVADSKDTDPRRVPLAPGILAELKARKGLPDGYVLLGDDGKHPPYETSITSAFRKTAVRIGLTGLRFHDTRHVAATRFLAAGASLPEVASILGHRTLIMARRYAHTTWSRLRAVVDAAGGTTVEGLAAVAVAN